MPSPEAESLFMAAVSALTPSSFPSLTDIFSLNLSSKTPYTKGDPDPVVWNLSGIDPPAASSE